MSDHQLDGWRADITVDGPPETHAITDDQLRAYLVGKGWEKTYESDKDDFGHALGGRIEQWTRPDTIGPFVHVWATLVDGDRIANTVRQIARHEKRHPAHVLRDIAATPTDSETP